MGGSKCQEARELEQIYRHTPVGLCFIDCDLRIVRINEQAAAMSGPTVAEHIGRTVREIIPRLAEQVEPILARVVALGEPALNVEIHGETAAEPGVQRHWLANYSPLKADDGIVLGVTAAVVEISDQKRSQRKLSEYARRLQHLSVHMMRVLEAERKRLARDLHDEIGQVLTAVKMNLEKVHQVTAGSEATACLNDCLGVVKEALSQVHNLAMDLRPPMLDDLGLAAALRWHLNRQAERSGLSIQLLAEPEELWLPNEVAIACFRVVQEALNNIIKYAHARSVRVSVRQTAGELELTIHDDGVGFDAREAYASTATGGNLGVLGMQDRAHLLGGTCQVSSEPTQGTTIELSLPLPEPARDDRGRTAPMWAPGPETSSRGA